jgi:hypothetical protein
VGGKKKSQVVGFKYHAGSSMVLCQGAIDKVISIYVGDRQAWKGAVQDGTIYIDKPHLFGGESREGGVSGVVDISSGHHEQKQNSYLKNKISNLVPAYRHVAGLVFRSFYWGNNPYLKEVSAVVRRIHYQDSRKTPQWYGAKAEIRTDYGIDNTAVHFILDTSSSMRGERIEALKSAMKKAINNLATSTDLNNTRLDIGIATYQGGYPQTYLHREIKQKDISNLLSFIDRLQIVGGENLDKVLSDSVSFFKPILNTQVNKSCIFVSDGELSDVDDINSSEIHDFINKRGIFDPSKGRDVNIYCINIDNYDISLSSKIDNTPEDGVPVIAGNDTTAIYDTLMYGINANGGDMNPAHILREMVISKHNGFNSQVIKNIINEESFRHAADVFYKEKLGLSYIWNDQSKFDDLKKKIENTVDCILYQNAKTNQFEIKLIRNDYNASDLPIFDKSNIVKISEIKKNIITEMINSVTVNFIDRQNNYKQGSVTVRDDALIAMIGRENNTTVTYDMVYCRSLAARLAMRDLSSLSSDLASVTLTLDISARVLNNGDVFILNLPDLGLDNVVMRVTSADFGTLKNNQITIECSRDVFSLPSTAVIDIQPPISTPIDLNVAKPTTQNLIIESPYYELVHNYGQRLIDMTLSSEPGIGQIAAVTATPPEGTLSMSLVTSLSNEFKNEESVTACESIKLIEDVDLMANTIILQSEPISEYTWVQINNEIMYVEEVKDCVLTVKRGCLDTLPEPHKKNAVVWFCGDCFSVKSDEYYAGDLVDCRIITTTSTDKLNPTIASGATIEIKGRAGRPYPPSNVIINNAYYPNFISSKLINVRWSSRNRKQQTSSKFVGWFDGNVTPEPGTKYKVTITQNDTILYEVITSETDINIDLSSVAVGEVDLTISTIVSGVYSLFSFKHTFKIESSINFIFNEEQPETDKLLFKFKE